MIRAGMRRGGANAQWLCTTCYYCTVSARGIDQRKSYAVKSIGIETGRRSEQRQPKFYETFCDTVHKFGHQHGPTLMAIYAFRAIRCD